MTFVIWFLTLFLVLPQVLWSASFTINFSDINIENVQPGVPVSLLEKASFLANATNMDSEETEIKFEIIIPDSSQLTKGYEPIADKRWIKMKNSSLFLKPNERHDFDLIVYAPYNKDLFGKKYHAILMTYTLEGIMKINLKSNIYIDFSSEYFERAAIDTKIQSNKPPNISAIMISPKIKHIKNIKFPAKTEFSDFMITNVTDQKKTVSLIAVELENLPEIKEMVSFKEQVIELEPKQSKKIDIILNFPNLELQKNNEMNILISAQDLNANDPNGTTAVIKINYD